MFWRYELLFGLNRYFKHTTHLGDRKVVTKEVVFDYVDFDRNYNILNNFSDCHTNRSNGVK